MGSLMSEADDETLGQGLLYEDFLSLRWHTMDERALTLATPGLNENNEEVLRFIGILDEYPSEFGDEHEPISQDLARLESKLNLLLGLVGQLVAVHFPQPPARAVKLSPAGVEWLGEETMLPQGETGVVEIYLNGLCPRPLKCPGRIERVELADGGGYHTVASFTALSASVREHLEKMIFRHHRRSVAMARRRTIQSPII
jgi:hypothetical protein